MRTSVTVSWVCLFVCLSVKSHLTSGACVRPENAVTYLAGNEGEKISLKLLRYGDPALPPSYGHTYRQPFFTHVRYTYEHALEEVPHVLSLHHVPH